MAFIWSAMGDVGSFLVRALECSVFMKPSFWFAYVKVTAVQATSFLNDFTVIVWKERFDSASGLKNYLEIDK